MKSRKSLIPLLLVLALLLALSALPAFAQEPTATPAAPAAAGTAVATAVPITVPLTTTTPLTTTAPTTATVAVATPAPTGKSYVDPLPLSCDWEGIDAGSPEAYTTKYYKVPYAKETYLVIYLFMEKKSQLKGFGFDVFDAYNATLLNRPGDDKAVVWDNWGGQAAGIGMPANKVDPWDLDWVGKGNNGTSDSWFMVILHNSNPDPVYYKLCSLNRG